MDDLLKAHTLLVIPSDDLRGMLDGGPCGFRPPMAWHCSREQVVPVSCYEVAYISVGSKQALVLRWEGQDMPHGWLAAELALPDWTRWKGSPRSLLLKLIREADCTIVALDEQGKEMTDD